MWSFLIRLALLAACGQLAQGVLLLARRFPTYAAIVFAGIVWRRLRGIQPDAGDSHGSARVATDGELAARGLLGEDGLIMGRLYGVRPFKWQAALGLLNPRLRSADACRQFLSAFYGRRWQSERLIRIKKFVHLMTIAPAGAGKSVSVIVPNLLSYRHSCVIVDPKGELFKLTETHRRKRFRHKVYRLDPAGICDQMAGPGGCMNPLDYIDQHSPGFISDCRALAGLIVMRQGTEHEPHWNDKAEEVIACFIAFVCAFCTDRTQRNLNTVRHLLSSRQRYEKSIGLMQAEEGFGGLLARAGHSLTWTQDKELSSVMSHVSRHSQWLDSQPVAACVASSSFDLRSLKSGKADLYLCLPHQLLTVLAPLQRVWLGTLLRVVGSEANESNPILFILDEAAHLGRIQAVEDAVTLMRGMGIRLWFFFQSLDQVTKCFGDRAATVIDNMQTTQYFGINSYSTAEAISQRIGDCTILLRSLSENWGSSRQSGGGPQGPSGSTSSGGGSSSSHTGRRLFRPEEVLTFPDDLCIVFHRNMHAIPARLLKYYDAPEFRRGGVGRSRGLGLAAGVLATLTLGLSGIAASLAALPASRPARRPAYGYPPALHRPASPYRSGRSGAASHQRFPVKGAWHGYR